MNLDAFWEDYEEQGFVGGRENLFVVGFQQMLDKCHLM